MEFDFAEYKSRVEEHNQSVTVFMLTHNREHYVEIAINSILDQTFSNYTLIVLDNCSEDNTRQTVLKISDPRVMYLYRESTPEDSNTVFAQKTCLTDYFIILHDDDVLEANYLETIINEMNTSDCVAVSVRCSIIDENGNFIKKNDNIKKGKLIYKDNQYLKSRFINPEDGMIYPSVIYRTSFYKQFPDFGGKAEVGPAGDQFIWFESERMGGKLCLLPDVLFRYRRHSKQESNIHNGTMNLQLYDYLIQDAYYEEQLKNVFSAYAKKIWIVNKSIMLKYSMNALSKKDYMAIFNRPSVQYLKRKVVGLPIYIGMKVMYTFKDGISAILRRRSNVRNTFVREKHNI